MTSKDSFDGDFKTPKGMSIIASVGTGKSKKINYFENENLLFKENSKMLIVFNECGHMGSKEFEFDIWGNAHKFGLKKEQIKKRDGTSIAEGICPKCYFEKLKQVAIRCCLCGYGILPDDGIALYHKDSNGINSEVATFVGESAIGCLLWDCCPSGGFFAGYWTFNGFKPAFEGQTGAERAFSTRKIIVSNI